MKAGFNYVLFKVEGNDIYNRQTQHRGAGGLPLEVDPTYEPWKWIKTWGRVVQIPIDLTKKNMIFGAMPLGYPGYNDLRGLSEVYKINIFRTMDEIHQDVRVGDKVYFHHNTLLRFEQSLTQVKFEYDSKVKGMVEVPIFKVSYDQIKCVVRNNKIIMIGGNVLIEPDMEDWEDILVPTYYDPKLNGGKLKRRPKSEWIQSKVQPEAKYLLGYVRHVGKAYIGEEQYLKEGDKILYKPNADWKVEIEGKEYFCMNYNHIEAMVEEK